MEDFDDLEKLKRAEEILKGKPQNPLQHWWKYDGVKGLFINYVVRFRGGGALTKYYGLLQGGGGYFLFYYVVCGIFFFFFK
jgi:hypothetical protein